MKIFLIFSFEVDYEAGDSLFGYFGLLNHVIGQWRMFWLQAMIRSTTLELNLKYGLQPLMALTKSNSNYYRNIITTSKSYQNKFEFVILHGD